MATTGRQTAFLAIAFVAFLLALVSCVSFRGPQSWPIDYGPVIPHDTFPADCSTCHVSSSWHEIRSDFAFDHGARTGLVLEGAHARARCLFCHNDRGDVAVFASRGCRGCHEDPHRGQLGDSCRDCHGEENWVPRNEIIEHLATRFPLVGGHAAVPCLACHEGATAQNFTRVEIECQACHRGEISRSTVLDHVANGLDTDCQRCHTPTSWSDATFAHPTSFPLTASHAIACRSCHSTDGFVGLSDDCAACHQSEFEATVAPPHVAAEFSTDCQGCHSTGTWSTAAATFEHPEVFAMTGAHAVADCAGCHESSTFDTPGTDCVSCHAADYAAATEPAHAAAGIPTTCDDCHTTESWPVDYEHPATFPLVGVHTTASCSS
ncbi:MAG: hypothetical protein KDC38_00970, partial [Planctomycetes bacterium]|nr:hypothetical protein [Planctomycetota bacterium]